MKISWVSLFTTLFLILLSCEEPINDQNNAPVGPVVNENTVVIDSTSGRLLSDSVQLSEGIYVFELSDALQDVTDNSIIVGTENGGYLRKVISVNNSNNQLVLTTEQATIEELFERAVIAFDFDLSGLKSASLPTAQYQGFQVNYLAEGVKLSEDGLHYDFTNTPLYHDEDLTITLSSGSVNFVPNFTYNLEVEDLTLQMVELKANNTSLKYNCDLLINGASSANLLNESKTLADISRNFIVWAGIVPIVVSVNTRLTAGLILDLSAAFEARTGFSGNFDLDFSAGYKMSEWYSEYNISPSFNIQPLKLQGTANLNQQLIITPEVSITFYKFATAGIVPDLKEELDINLAFPSLNWDAALITGMNTTFLLSADIFGKNIGKYEKSYPLEGLGWNAPDKIELVSGNNQEGNQGEPLPEPVKVRVLDNYGNAIPYVPVYFQVEKGDGTVDVESILSDENGMAQTTWTLGAGEEQELSAKAVKADNSLVSGAPVKIVANAEPIYEFYIREGVASAETFNETLKWIGPYKNGDKLEIPNNMYVMFSVKLNGQQIEIDPNRVPYNYYSNSLVGISGIVELQPIGLEDVVFNNYNFELYDQTNGRPIDFNFDLTVSNKAYSSLVNRTVNVRSIAFGSEQSNLNLHFNADGTYDIQYSDGTSGGTANYSFVYGIAYAYNVCQTYTISKREIADVKLSGPYPSAPSYFIIYEDGSIEANSFYACTDAGSYYEIE